MAAAPVAVIHQPFIPESPMATRTPKPGSKAAAKTETAPKPETEIETKPVVVETAEAVDAFQTAEAIDAFQAAEAVEACEAVVETAQFGIGPGEQVDAQGLGPVQHVVTHFHVSAKVDGFRRCGRAWPANGVRVPVDDFTEDQLERLLAESELVVVPISDPSDAV